MIKINKENMVDDIFDALEMAKKAHELLPPLPPDMKPVYFRILNAMYRIRDEEGNCRVTGINKALDFLLPNTTKFINEMVQIKVVEKFNDASDKRVVLVHATELGERYMTEHIVKYHDFFQKEFSALDEKEYIAMIETIKKVYTIMKKVYEN